MPDAQSLDQILATVDKGFAQSLERLFHLLRIPSLSGDPAYHAACGKAADFLVQELAGLGFAAEKRGTGGKPIVVAHYVPKHTPKSSPKKKREKPPHILFYGHYDVQPADPISLWKTPPFEPVIGKGKKGQKQIFARGAADDKGQLLTFIEAIRAFVAVRGSLPLRLSILIEGEEESGSPSLLPFLRKYKRELSCDCAFICDTNMWDEKTPAITTSLRGIVADEITLHGPRMDLHSGAYGGVAANPLHILAKILASLHDERGRVAIPNFYKGVGPLPAAIRKQWQNLKFSEKKFLSAVGLEHAAGEKGLSVLEKLWARPTAEVNGFWGGYTGAGTKTVIPALAQAKITFRLVGKQDPKAVREAFRNFVKKQVPVGCRVSFSKGAHGTPASEVERDNAFLAATAVALEEEFGCKTVLMGCGGSIPITRHFKDVLGLDCVLLGFGLEDDAIHSPNEKYDVASFRHGIRSFVRLLDKLSPDKN